MKFAGVNGYRGNLRSYTNTGQMKRIRRNRKNHKWTFPRQNVRYRRAYSCAEDEEADNDE